MPNRPFSLSLALATFTLPGAAFAQVSGNQPATSKVILLEQATFIEVRDLDFGSMVIPATGTGTLTVPADGTAPVYTDISPISTSSPMRGRLIGAASASTAVQVDATLPSVLYLNGDPLAATLPVNLTFDLAPTTAGPPSIWNYTTDAAGVFNVYIGGTLSVPSTTATGEYSATFDVTATYP